jgi:hypothetical protein
MWLAMGLAGLVAGQADPQPVRRADLGAVKLGAAAGDQIIGLTAGLIVPRVPAPYGTSFVWLGLQPRPGPRFLPIGNGVLQTVLSWGRSCAPGAKPALYSGWWISAQYVNTIGHAPGFTGCLGGPTMQVRAGDTLGLAMTLAGETWRETVTDVSSHRSVSFGIDLRGQVQSVAEFEIESYGGPAISAAFSNVEIAFGHPAVRNCHVLSMGPNDRLAGLALAGDARSCSVARIGLGNRLADRGD